MTDADVRSMLRERYGVSRETLLANYAAILREENERQNLIARSTVSDLWTRHILDSEQLLRWGSTGETASWLDIGSGAGLPGIVLAILHSGPVALVEPRRKRAEFLSEVSERLGLANVRVFQRKIEQVKGEKADCITARAVASLPSLFASSIHCAHKDSVFILPKGRSAHSEVEAAREAWQGMFHVEQSVTDPGSHIVIAREVSPK
tara:strand:+ start:1259 stop:1876 length:618 start_codon:yes stop_codon:yes gene_type:complete